YEDHNLTLSPCELSWNTGAHFRCEATINKSMVNGSYKAEHVPLDFIHFFVPSNIVTGRISGEGTLQGSLDNPDLHLQLTSDCITLGAEKVDLFIPLKLSLQLDAKDNQAICFGKLSTIGRKEPLKWNIKLPIEIQKIPFAISFSPDKPLEGNIEGSAEIAPFLAPLLAEDQLVEGIIKRKLKLQAP
ncbi:MAG: hypothetical protein JWO53_52, partial [Chlamydiia bacterium]|nr:hypothetical protein [Chlamydiia bacterium]